MSTSPRASRASTCRGARSVIPALRLHEEPAEEAGPTSTGPRAATARGQTSGSATTRRSWSRRSSGPSGSRSGARCTGAWAGVGARGGFGARAGRERRRGRGGWVGRWRRLVLLERSSLRGVLPGCRVTTSGQDCATCVARCRSPRGTLLTRGRSPASPSAEPAASTNPRPSAGASSPRAPARARRGAPARARRGAPGRRQLAAERRRELAARPRREPAAGPAPTRRALPLAVPGERDTCWMPVGRLVKRIVVGSSPGANLIRSAFASASRRRRRCLRRGDPRRRSSAAQTRAARGQVAVAAVTRLRTAALELRADQRPQVLVDVPEPPPVKSLPGAGRARRARRARPAAGRAAGCITASASCG